MASGSGSQGSIVDVLKVVLTSAHGWMFIPLSISSYFAFKLPKDQNPNALHFMVVGGNAFANIVVFGLGLAAMKSEGDPIVLLYRLALFIFGLCGGGVVLHGISKFVQLK